MIQVSDDVDGNYLPCVAPARKYQGSRRVTYGVRQTTSVDNIHSLTSLGSTTLHAPQRRSLSLRYPNRTMGTLAPIYLAVTIVRLVAARQH